MTRIYLITNLLNGKQYVGKTVHSLSYRFSQHCNNDYYHTYIHNAIVKYGKENFKIEEICICDDDHWKELETFYIKFYHTHYSEGGYNLTWGGESNPMDDPVIRQRQKERVNACETHRKQSSETIRRFNQSEARKELDKRTSERQRGIYLPQFEAWNKVHRRPIAMIDEDGNELMRFDTFKAAFEYLKENEGITCTIGCTGAFKRFADKFNKNGKRAKYLGHSWHLL